MTHRFAYLKAVRLASEIAWNAGETGGGAARAGGPAGALSWTGRSAGGVVEALMR
jgi:hypothetical protein